MLEHGYRAPIEPWSEQAPEPVPPDASDETDLHFARAMLREGAAAIDCLANAIDESFADAARLILAAQGRLIIGGLGKSGHVGRKLAATFSSTGTPALFLHLAEALHGDLGGVRRDDIALLISHSGETAELHPVIAFLRDIDVPIIAISSSPGSALIAASAIPILLPALRELCPARLAPSTSTLMTLAVGDALALTVMRNRRFGAVDFHRVHPAGSLGNRLRPVSAVMRRDEAIPLVAPDMPIMQAAIEMTAKRIGATGVIDHAGRLIGIVTDGDLRRHLGCLPAATAGDIMTRNAKTVCSLTTIDDAMALCTEEKISVLFVVDDPLRLRPSGVVHLHDLSPSPPAG